MRKSICLVSGGFDPLHRGHIEYFKAAKRLSDYLIVALNSDDWLSQKKGYAFMPWEERASIIKNLEIVDEVIAFDDKDMSASDAIEKSLTIAELVIFANGGDRFNTNTPETQTCKKYAIEMLWGVGGGKIQSSSDLVANIKQVRLDD